MGPLQLVGFWYDSLVGPRSPPLFSKIICNCNIRGERRLIPDHVRCQARGYIHNTLTRRSRVAHEEHPPRHQVKPDGIWILQLPIIFKLD